MVVGRCSVNNNEGDGGDAIEAGKETRLSGGGFDGTAVVGDDGSWVEVMGDDAGGGRSQT